MVAPSSQGCCEVIGIRHRVPSVMEAYLAGVTILPEWPHPISAPGLSASQGPLEWPLSQNQVTKLAKSQNLHLGTGAAASSH